MQGQPRAGGARGQCARGAAWSVAALLAVSTACGRSDLAAPASGATAPQDSQASPTTERGAEFVVFSGSRVVISSLESPVPAPVTVGSSPSPATLASDAPDVVSISGSGELVGHRNGHARISNLTSGGGVLEVEVAAVGAGGLAVRPPDLVLAPGAEAPVSLIEREGRRVIPPDEAVWASNAPEVAMVMSGRVLAGRTPGTAHFVVTYAGQQATFRVVVKPPEKRSR